MDRAALLAHLADILGPSGLLTEPADFAPFASDWRNLRHGLPLAVARPADTDQVAAILRACDAAGVAVVPQGGHTSMAIGATPNAAGEELVLSLGRMAAIGDVDPLDLTMTLQAGVTLRAAQLAAEAAGCLLPLSIGSEGSAQIGGVLSTNAGGNNTLRYGNARDLVLGLEVVLADGTVIAGLRRLRKDNTGYALRQLFVGAEGTLGVITAAVLRLQPAPSGRELALAALPSAEAALAVLARLQRHDSGALVAFEYISDAAMRLVLRHIEGVSLPVEAAPCYALIDLAASREDAGLRDGLEAVLGAALEAGEANDVVIAESLAQRAALWRLREEQSEAQKRAGASIKNDVSVPVSRTPALLAQAASACEAVFPGVVIAPFGHLGDGNIHVNLVQPEGADPADFLAHATALTAAVDGVVRALEGSFSAEHGIGALKVAQLAEWRGGAELETMRRIKQALDPNNILNPGRVLG